MVQLEAIYRNRFVAQTGLAKRNRVWRVLCESFFDDLIGADKDVLDVACGYGEFINNVAARHKTALDLNPDASSHLSSDICFVHCSALQMELPDESSDVAFASNFLEHLRSKDELVTLFGEVRRVLRPGGKFVIMGPNIKYAYREYWDFFDHYLPLSHLSLAEGLEANGFQVIRNTPRFLPFTMAGAAPTADFLVRAYLRLPPAWALLGKQFLLVGRKEE